MATSLEPDRTDNLSDDELRDGLRLIERSLTDSPDDGSLWELKGNILGRLGRPTAARKALERAATLIPLADTSWVAMAAALAEEGRADLAFSTVRTLFEDDSVEIDAICHAVELLAALGEFEFAIEAARRACDEQPDNPSGYHRLAVLCDRGGRPDNIIESLHRRAMSLAPEQIDYRIALATFFVGRRRLPCAYSVLKSLSTAQIASVSCECCLKRLRDVFTLVGDRIRADACVVALDGVADRKQGSAT
ncbi:MAG: hypothetical protein AAF532_15125 [Planctomycetota bacterium]